MQYTVGLEDNYQVQVPLNWSDQFQKSCVKVILPSKTRVQERNTSCERQPVVFNTTAPEDWTRCYVNEVLRRDTEKSHRDRDDVFSSRMLLATETVYTRIKSRETDTYTLHDEYATYLQSIALHPAASSITTKTSPPSNRETQPHIPHDENLAVDSKNLASSPQSSLGLRSDRDDEQNLNSLEAKKLISSMESSERIGKEQYKLSRTKSSLPSLNGHPSRMWTVQRHPESLGVTGRHFSSQIVARDIDELIQRQSTRVVYDIIAAETDGRTTKTSRDNRRPINATTAGHLMVKLRDNSSLKSALGQHRIDAAMSRSGIFTISKSTLSKTGEQIPSSLINNRSGINESLSFIGRLYNRSSRRRPDATLKNSRGHDGPSILLGDARLIGCQQTIGSRTSSSGNVSRTISRDSGISCSESTKMTAVAATSRPSSAKGSTEQVHNIRIATDARVRQAADQSVYKLRRRHYGNHRLHSAAPPPSPA